METIFKVIFVYVILRTAFMFLILDINLIKDNKENIEHERSLTVGDYEIGLEITEEQNDRLKKLLTEFENENKKSR